MMENQKRVNPFGKDCLEIDPVDVYISIDIILRHLYDDPDYPSETQALRLSLFDLSAQVAERHNLDLQNIYQNEEI